MLGTIIASISFTLPTLCGALAGALARKWIMNKFNADDEVELANSIDKAIAMKKGGK